MCYNERLRALLQTAMTVLLHVPSLPNRQRTHQTRLSFNPTAPSICTIIRVNMVNSLNGVQYASRGLGYPRIGLVGSAQLLHDEAKQAQ